MMDCLGGARPEVEAVLSVEFLVLKLCGLGLSRGKRRGETAK
jgi:hypothetical protein